MAKKCTMSHNARAQPLFCSLNLLFNDVPVVVAVVVILNSLLLLYGCEIWGPELLSYKTHFDKSTIEQVHIKFCKQTLNTPWYVHREHWVVTHAKVNSIPKVNNTRVNSPWELCDRGACGHTLNTLPRSVINRAP